MSTDRTNLLLLSSKAVPGSDRRRASTSSQGGGTQAKLQSKPGAPQRFVVRFAQTATKLAANCFR